jgi:hypothetical protein
MTEAMKQRRNPDALVKTTEKGRIALTEEELSRASAGWRLSSFLPSVDGKLDARVK